MNQTNAQVWTLRRLVRVGWACGLVAAGALAVLLGYHRVYGLGHELLVDGPDPVHHAPAVEAVEAVTAEAVAELLDRAETLDELWRQVEDHYQAEVAPIERVLLSYRDDPELVRRIALALVREARHSGLEPRLLLAVLLVENPWLDPLARSPVGARGLMQVMPMHLGQWPPCPPDLDDVDANICYGARIFAHYFEAANGNLDRALLRYNGCVRGTNTPDCHRYPDHVFARAGRASIQAALSPPPARAAAP